MLNDLSWLKRVKILNESGSLINPATNEKLEELRLLLTQIEENTDELEINTESINLNTDELEAKVQSVKDAVDTLSSLVATESTTQSVLDALGVESGNSLLNELKSIAEGVNEDLSDIDTKLQSLIDKNQAQETGGNLDNIKTNSDNLDTELSTRASESTLQEVKDTIGQESGTTILSRLQDLWNKLVELFNEGGAKVKLWDGENQVGITSENKLKVESYQPADTAYLITGNNKVDNNNSTILPLNPSGEFLGQWTNILNYSMIILQITTNVSSAIDGVEIQWSSDGINIDDYDYYTINANGGKIFSFGCQNKYYRIKYTNGLTIQSFFRLTTIMKFSSQKPSSHRIKDNITDENDAELVKSVLTGKISGTNTFSNVVIDSNGRLQVAIPPAVSNIPIQLLWDKPHSAVNSGEWQELLYYTIPDGYDFNAVTFAGTSQFANEHIRAVQKTIGATFNCSTDTFTDGSYISLPKFATRMYLYVTSTIGASVNDDITITYTNNKGITGRTANVTITKSSATGTRLEVPLQTGDDGVIDITNVIHSATGQAGGFRICFYIEFFYLMLSSSGVLYQSNSVSLGGIVVPEKETVYLEYLSATKTTYNRRINLYGTLVPK